ncbi:MAG TPA: hypothetical protein VMV05_02500, partial [bacterium]|nr:hypothetical protein [bacterium]
PTPTYTATPTLTPTNTSTPPPTATFTPTPVGFHIWPNPFNPNYANDRLLKAYLAPPNSRLEIYTVSGELVRSIPEVGGTILWEGKNNYNVYVSTGTYYYVVRDKGDKALYTGKLLVIMDH